MPYKVWAVNEILTAADMNTYVGNQTILTFAGTAARASAVGTPVEGMLSYVGSGVVEVYAGTATGWQSVGLNILIETSEKTADYTLALGDFGQIVQMNKSGTATLTVPTNASVAFPVGTVIGVYNRSSDAVTVAGDSGVTVRNAGGVGQYAEASLRKRATDEWVMVGG